MVLTSAMGSSQGEDPTYHQTTSLLSYIAFFCSVDSPDYQTEFVLWLGGCISVIRSCNHFLPLQKCPQREHPSASTLYPSW